ncbi:MAG: fibronectin type III domain-containing protein [Thermoplasmatales archaeon]|nr:fibronectin type III domain-containing protein [Candidatus Thermoplasmatota archaeon]MCG2827479.1 fibronectin type III domain-containing protein [Thermoplasmatales archaeon]
MKKIFVFCIVVLFLLALPVNAEEKQNPRISNISSASVVISWVADEKCIGIVHYGTNKGDLNLTETDSSKRENGVIMVEITGLTNSTKYYFEIVSGDVLDNNNDLYYTFKTAEISKDISMPFLPLGGQVLLDNGENADGTMVYVTVQHDGINSTLLSYMVLNGYWGVDLANLKHEDGTAFTEWEVNDTLYIEIEGGEYGYKNVTTIITGDITSEGYQNCTTPTEFKALPELETPETKSSIDEYNRILIAVFCIVMCLVAVMVYLLRREQK